MSDLTIEEFCQIHMPCGFGRNWAMTNCVTMVDCWANLPDDDLIWTATRPGVLVGHELRLFTIYCCREIQDLLVDPRSAEAVNVSERYAGGQATHEELAAAQQAATRAMEEADPADYVAASAAMWSAYVTDAVSDETLSSAYHVVNDTTRLSYAITRAAYAAHKAADTAARAASGAAANPQLVYEATRQNQAAWFRIHAHPNFTRVEF